MKNTILLLLFIIPFTIEAQDYTGSVGIRGGYSSGIDFKGFLGEEKAVEALMSWRDGGMQFTMLLEKYRPVFLGYSEHLFLYMGYGAHVGYTRWYKRFEDDMLINGHQTYYYQRRSSPVIGADAIIGLEYRMYRLPFAFGLDAKPYAELFGQHFFDVNTADFAFSVRYTF